MNKWPFDACSSLGPVVRIYHYKREVTKEGRYAAVQLLQQTMVHLPKGVTIQLPCWYANKCIDMMQALKMTYARARRGMEPTHGQWLLCADAELWPLKLCTAGDAQRSSMLFQWS